MALHTSKWEATPVEELVSVEEHQKQQLRVLVQKEKGRAHCEQTEEVIQCGLLS